MLTALAIFSTSVLAADDERLLQEPEHDLSWERCFEQESGWTGGDVAGSIDLRDGRTLWVFGDSWIGDVAGRRHIPPSRLVNNAIGIHSLPLRRPWNSPDPSNVRFYWGAADANENPTAWIIPESTSQTPDEKNAANDWYWPTGGGLTVERSDGKRRLVLFLYRVRKGNQPGSVMNFRVVGTAMAVVDRVDGDADAWQPRRIDLPENLANVAKRGDQQEMTTRWGMAVSEASAKGANDKHIYIFGMRNSEPLNGRLMLARVAPDDVERFDTWQFYTREGRWSQQSADAAPVADRMVSEFSIEPVQIDGRTTFLLVQSEPLFGQHIWARTAPRPEGPWTKPVEIHTVTEIDDKPSLFTYAAKGHAGLSRPGEILVTYLINSRKFSEILNDASLYRPRFLRVPLRATIAN